MFLGSITLSKWQGTALVDVLTLNLYLTATETFLVTFSSLPAACDTHIYTKKLGTSGDPTYVSTYGTSGPEIKCYKPLTLCAQQSAGSEQHCLDPTFHSSTS